VLELVRGALAGQDAWLVGGAVRDRLRGIEQIDDYDIVLGGDVAGAARSVARAGDAAAFQLSDEFGAWRVVARSGAWQVDLNPLRGAGIEADLARRDFTVNAIAEPLAGGDAVDPLGGLLDLQRGLLRLAAPDALRADPLRAMRLVRLACELSLAPDAAARGAAEAAAPGLAEVAAERIYLELRRILASDAAGAGVRMLVELGIAAVVLPELAALAGVDQHERHHLDVLEHTLATLDAAVALQREPAEAFGDHAAEITALLQEPLADGVNRAVALRFGALLHDIAKPATRAVGTDGSVTFFGHDELGAELARTILRRLRAAERLQAHVAALTREHLRLGFLVAQAPLERRALYGYLDACGSVAADVTLLSVVDRLATRGVGSERAIERHLALAREVFGEALLWQRTGPPAALVRGDELATALELPLGPRIGALLAQIAEAQFAGDVATREAAIAFARGRIA
jgi:putative nucleotidyltransferase with HDIG domain